MDNSTRQRNPNPKDNANFLSQLVFGYTIPLFRKGYTKELTEKDLYDPLESDQSEKLGNRLDKQWAKQMKRKHPSFLRALVATFAIDFIKLLTMLLFQEVGIRIMQPILLGQLLKYFQHDSTMPHEEAITYAVGMIICTFVYTFTNNHFLTMGYHNGMKWRVATCSVVYRKSLRLSKTALGETASGQIVNLLSSDVSRFELSGLICYFLVVAPLTALVILYLIYEAIGVAGLVGMVVVFTVAPIQMYTGMLSSRFRLRTALKTDERVRLMEEIISGIQVIKMYAWEYPLAKFVQVARKAEMSMVLRSSYVRGLYMMFVLFTTRCALYATLLTMVFMGKDIKVSEIFVLQSFFAILSQSMSMMFIRSLTEAAETLVSFKRIENFLLLPEFSEDTKQITNSLSPGIAVQLIDLNAKWNPCSSEQVLHDLNLTVGEKKLLGIIGPVGSGKSSILQTLLGELYFTGSMQINGTISYASQEAWVFGASIRQNILFGEKYEKQRYWKVTSACALRKDFEQFPDGDMTMVGDRGASLSGGQKARINLARAVYRKADIYLLDDPLSAVDSHVGRHLFDECINGFLMDKTRILVTHQLQYMKDADHLIVLRDGRVEMQGTFYEIVHSDLDYALMLTAEPELDEKEQEDQLSAAKQTAKQLTRQKTVSINSAGSFTENEDPVLKAKTLEQSSKGSVKGNLFLQYFKSGTNCCTSFLLIFLFVGAQFLAGSCDWFVSFWATEEELRRANSTEYADVRDPILSREVSIYIYTGLIVGVFLVALTRSIAIYKTCCRNARRLHDKMFFSIIKTGMRFFDTNPAGRILNRFSKDMNAVDELLPKAIVDACQNILVMLSAIVLTTIANPWFLVPLVFIGILFHLLKIVYLRTSQNVKRLEGISRSPVFTHLYATLQGLTTIRAYGAQSILQREFDKHQDLNTGASFMFISSGTAFAFGLDILTFTFVTTIILFFVFIIGREESAGNVGLAITQAISLTGMVQWGMRQMAEVQNQLMSAERILEYTNLPPEPNFESDKPLPKSWPTNAGIKFQNTCMKYAPELPIILRNLNINIEPQQKIGIVGRTGAGKSSIIASLFRLAVIEGKILIDGVDTNEIDLQNLRKKISIIPQDPVLFSGSMRRNLDPFEEYPDVILWDALRDVELKDVLEHGLYTKVLDHGANFSVGQKQLICLARAIVRMNKILVLDEATANVDPQTDMVIQKTIAEKFSDCTVLTIAHRLNTIMESDKVLVMDSGEMVEFDHPFILLQNKNGHFTKMVEETGPIMSEQLFNVAKSTFNRKKINS